MKSESESVAIVGAGSIGQRYIRLVNENFPDLKVMAVSSHLFSNPNIKAIQYEVYASLELAIDAGANKIIIANTANLHLQSIITAISRGIVPLVEKPILKSSRESKQLNEHVQHSQIYPLVGYNLRRYAAMIQLKKLISTSMGNQSGRVQIRCHSYMPAWRPGRDYKTTASAKFETGGGVLLELSHEIDYAVWFFGRISEVECTLSNSLDLDVETSADLVLRFATSLEVHLSLKMDSFQECRDFRFYGEKHNIYLNLLTMELQIEGNGQLIKNKFKSNRDETFINQLQEYFSNMSDSSPFKGRYLDALHVMDVIAAAKDSAARGESIKIG